MSRTTIVWCGRTLIGAIAPVAHGCLVGPQLLDDAIRAGKIASSLANSRPIVAASSFRVVERDGDRAVGQEPGPDGGIAIDDRPALRGSVLIEGEHVGVEEDLGLDGRHVWVARHRS